MSWILSYILAKERISKVISQYKYSYLLNAELLYNAGEDISNIINVLKSVNYKFVATVFARVYSVDFIRILCDYLDGDSLQKILYYWIDIIVDVDKLIDLLTYNASDKILATNETLIGVQLFKTLDLNGYTYTADGQPHVVIARSINIPSTSSLIKTPTGGAGGAPYATPGAGGAGGGGLIIITKSLTNAGVISADGVDGESGSTTAAIGSGSAGGNGFMYVIGNDTPGNGGSGGAYTSGAEGKGGSPGGGGGGGCSSTTVGGNGGLITLDNHTYMNYEYLLKDILKAAVDWWIQNVLGKTLTTAKSFPNCYGAGGGGGADYDGYDDSGGGGGSGGWIFIYATTLDFTGSITAKGGNGGNGGAEGTYDSGGGGGGGGIIYVLYRNGINLTGTLDVSGGAGGTGDYNGNAGTAGTAKLITI